MVVMVYQDQLVRMVTVERKEIKVNLEHLENKEYRDLLDQYQEELYIQDGEELHVQVLLEQN